MTKVVVTRELVAKVVCSSYITHQKVIIYSWILAITQAYSSLKSTSSTTTFNRQNHRGTCQFRLRVTQLGAGSSFGRKSSQVVCKLLGGWHRMSFGTVVNRSQVTLEIFISCKLLLSQTGNSRQSRPGRGLVANQLQSIPSQSVVDRKCIMAAGRGSDSGAWVYVNRLTNGVWGSRARKSIVVRSQVTLTTWPIIHF